MTALESPERAGFRSPFVRLSIQGQLESIILGLTGWVYLTAFLIIQPMKGAVIGLQWALKMHGFDGKGSDEAVDYSER